MLSLWSAPKCMHFVNAFLKLTGTADLVFIKCILVNSLLSFSKFVFHLDGIIVFHSEIPDPAPLNVALHVKYVVKKRTSGWLQLIIHSLCIPHCL